MSEGSHGKARLERAAEAWERARGRRLKVAELFVSLQGEGTRVGLPTAFLRLTGCALRCRWCDTEWAFQGGSWRTLEDLETELLQLDVPRVCVTGGEPLLQPSVVPLVRQLVEERGLDVIVETGGDQDISILPPGAVRILDIKLGGSGMAARMDHENVGRLTPRDEVKLVVGSRADYEEARKLVRGPLGGFAGAVLMGVVHGSLDAARLAEWILEDRLPVRLQTQLHKLLWPGRERGV